MKETPTTLSERIELLDIIRGFALLGIFLVNTPAYYSPDFVYRSYGIAPSLSQADQWIRLLFDMFVQGKFYPLFSFLFGLGFYLFMTRVEEKGLNRNRLFARRLIILFLLGIIHLIFLWYGDILHTYALVGFLLMVFFKRKQKTILVWAFSFLVLFFAITALPLLIPAPIVEQIQAANIETGEAVLGEAVSIYEEASYLEWISYRFYNEVLIVLSYFLFNIPPILAMFLFGLYAGKREIFRRAASNKKLVKGTWITSFILSIPALVFLVILSRYLDLGIHEETYYEMLISFSGITLCFFYITSIILLYKTTFKRKLSVFSYAGKMALTNYLMQTIISFIFFYGFELYGNVSLLGGLALTIIIFPLQIFFSYYWLKRFRYGPLEWGWRSLTYGYLVSLKKDVQKVTK